jgi:DNA-binding NarL/FixJ family response regulator
MLLLDLIMPGRCGTELISKVRSSYPGLRILVLSMHNETRVVLRALRAGASDTSARTACHTMLEAIRKVSTTGNTSAWQRPSRSRFYPVQ